MRHLNHPCFDVSPDYPWPSACFLGIKKKQGYPGETCEIYEHDGTWETCEYGKLSPEYDKYEAQFNKMEEL